MERLKAKVRPLLTEATVETLTRTSWQVFELRHLATDAAHTPNPKCKARRLVYHKSMTLSSALIQYSRAES